MSIKSRWVFINHWLPGLALTETSLSGVTDQCGAGRSRNALEMLLGILLMEVSVEAALSESHGIQHWETSPAPREKQPYPPM